MNNIINKRSEILFLYDIKDANPNGDPLDENKPRIDEETQINIVTDVRLKRTVRDYLYNFKDYNGKNDKDIFIREIKEEEGKIQDAKARAKNFLSDKDEILKKCIDVRLFGGTIPLEKDSITFTGPVQFKMGRSLNRVVVKHIKGTGAFASRADLKQKTFREEDIVKYSLIAFHGIINENAAKHTQLTENDVALLIEGMWTGTKNLISRSKFGQMPRLLIKINYNENNYFMGDLEKMVKMRLKEDKVEFEENIRDITEIQLDVTDLVNKLIENKKKMLSIEYIKDNRLELIKDNEIFEMKVEGIDFIEKKL